MVHLEPASAASRVASVDRRSQSLKYRIPARFRAFLCNVRELRFGRGYLSALAEAVKTLITSDMSNKTRHGVRFTGERIYCLGFYCHGHTQR